MGADLLNASLERWLEEVGHLQEELCQPGALTPDDRVEMAAHVRMIKATLANARSAARRIGQRAEHAPA